MLETINNNGICVSSNSGSNGALNDHYNPSVRMLQIPKIENGACGFHLSRSKWDPYPWVSAVDMNTPAEVTGLKAGDCVLEVNGEDVLGLRISDVANLVKLKTDHVSLLLWSTGMDPSCDPESLCCGPMPSNLERLSACMQTILAALECPVCMDTMPPPIVQCQNGHLLCIKCRMRSEKCPICRDRYCPGRALLAEQVYTAVTDAFSLGETCDQEGAGKLREKLFGAKCRRNNNSQLQSDMQKGIFQSHKHKFLAKLMGKSSSLENLSSSRKINGSGSQQNQHHVMLEVNSIMSSKPLSLSTNDISSRRNNQDETAAKVAIPRCPSANRFNASPAANIPSEDVSTTSGCDEAMQYSQRSRPVSLNASSEHLVAVLQLNSKTSPSYSLPVPKQIEEKCFYCPVANENCGIKLNSKCLQQHVKSHHNTPIICFGSSTAEISLPPKSPIEDASLIFSLDNKNFWVKLKIDENDGMIFTSALLQGFEDESLEYMLEVKIKNRVEDKLLQRELITRSIVYSLSKISWSEVLEQRSGICFDKNTLEATFGTQQELCLQASIKCREQ